MKRPYGVVRLSAYSVGERLGAPVFYECFGFLGRSKPLPYGQGLRHPLQFPAKALQSSRFYDILITERRWENAKGIQKQFDTRRL